MKAEIKIGSSILNISLLDSIAIYSDEGAVLYTSAAPEKKRGRKKKEVEPQPDILDLLKQQSVEVISNPEPKIEVVEPKTELEKVEDHIEIETTESNTIRNKRNVGRSSNDTTTVIDGYGKFKYIFQNGLSYPVEIIPIENQVNETIETKSDEL